MAEVNTVFACRRCGSSFEGVAEQLETATCDCVVHTSPQWALMPRYRPGIDDSYQMPSEIPES